MSNILTAKRLIIAQKHHWSISTLMEKYDISTPEALREEIHRVFVNEKTAEEYWQEFCSNEKRKEKREKKELAKRASIPVNPNADKAVNEDIQETEDFSVEELPSEELPSEELQLLPNEDIVAASPDSSANILEELHSRERELLAAEEAQSQSLMASEAHHKHCISQWWENHKRLDILDKELASLQKLILEKKGTALSLLEEMANLDAQVEEAYSQILADREQLEETRTMLEIVRIDIENASKATIYVFASGEISAENVTLPEISSVSDISLLIQYAADDGLTIGEIKTVSRLLKLVEWLDCKETSYDLIIESPKVQEFFEAVKAIET